MTQPPVIAVDGPAASGKGTLARGLADRLGFAYLDTGRLYRAVGLLVLRRGGDPRDTAVAAAAAADLAAAPEAPLDEAAIRAPEVAVAASAVAAIAAVRDRLFALQREFAAAPPAGRPGSVLDGRDIGTVICPHADAKLFVTARPEVRAERRFKELQARGRPAIFDEVLRDLKARDDRDRGRAAAPLAAAVDAFILDTSNLTIEQGLAAALRHIGACPRLAPFAAAASATAPWAVASGRAPVIGD